MFPNRFGLVSYCPIVSLYFEVGAKARWQLIVTSKTIAKLFFDRIHMIQQDRIQRKQGNLRRWESET